MRRVTAEPAQAERVVLDQPEVEHRFLVDPLHYKAFIGCVAPHLSSEVRDTSPVSHLLTTYYDTPDRRFFEATGRVEHARVRLRRNATSPGSDAPAVPSDLCAFEVKLSIFESRRIARLVDSPTAIDAILYRGGWRSDEDLMEVPALRHAARAVAMGRLRPALSTYYRRVSLCAPGVLITVDDHLAYARPVPLDGPDPVGEPDGVFHRSTQQILEVKLTVAPPAWLNDAMRLLRHANRPSKFQEGMTTWHRLSALSARAAPANDRTTTG
jgi:hypothetical protein